MKRIFRALYWALSLIVSARVTVIGWSMYPTLAPGERVLFDRLAYVRHGPRRGDVVLVRGPSLEGRGVDNAGRRIIKRVVGVPGDEVSIGQGLVLVNGSPVGDLSSETDGDGAEGQWNLKEDEYFLLGDAPDMSTDSRTFGPVAGRTIGAKAWMVYWPSGRRRVVDEG